jgi:hypothetical protein
VSHSFGYIPKSGIAGSYAALPAFVTESSVLRVWLLDPPHSPGQVQCSTPHLSVSVRLQFTVYAFQFCWKGGFSLHRGYAGLFSLGVGKRVTCSSVHSAVLCRQLWSQLAGRIGPAFFSMQCGQGSRMSQSLILIDAVSSKCSSNISMFLGSWRLGFLIPYPSCHFGSDLACNFLTLKI